MSSFFLPVKGSSRDRKGRKRKPEKKVSSDPVIKVLGKAMHDLVSAGERSKNSKEEKIRCPK